MIDLLTIRLASLAVHAEELLSENGCEADKAAIVGLLNDPVVREFLDDPKNKVLLPLKRRHPTPERK